MVERSYLSLAGAARQPENRCLKLKLSIRHAQAAKAGISKGMVSLVEHDLRNPTLDMIMRIARALRIELGGVISRVGREVEKKSKNL